MDRRTFLSSIPLLSVAAKVRHYIRLDSVNRSIRTVFEMPMDATVEGIYITAENVTSDLLFEFWEAEDWVSSDTVIAKGWTRLNSVEQKRPPDLNSYCFNALFNGGRINVSQGNLYAVETIFDGNLKERGLILRIENSDDPPFIQLMLLNEPKNI